jgi:hypothetical protein
MIAACETRALPSLDKLHRIERLLRTAAMKPAVRHDNLSFARVSRPWTGCKGAAQGRTAAAACAAELAARAAVDAVPMAELDASAAAAADCAAAAALEAALAAAVDVLPSAQRMTLPVLDAPAKVLQH